MPTAHPPHSSPTSFGARSTAEEVTAGLDLSGRTFLVTGANSGLGQETVRVLLLRGAHVLGAGRSAHKVLTAFPERPAQLTALSCDLSDPASILACVSEVERLAVQLDGIIGNAGIMALPQLELVHGIEKQFFTNHLGHFLLITRLLPQLASSGRVVLLSSVAHKMAPKSGIEWDNLDGSRGYQAWRAYGQSKLANLLFARELARRLPHPDQAAHAVHPGVIRTSLWRSVPGFLQTALRLVTPIFLKDISQGAATSCYVVTHPSLAGQTGGYFADVAPARSSRLGEDTRLSARLWEESERLLAPFLAGEDSRRQFTQPPPSPSAAPSPSPSEE